jgi:hypothetical protein
MKMQWFSIAALTAALALSAGIATSAAAAAQPAPSGFYQERPWDQPPNEYRDVQSQGFREGIEAARHDYDSHSRKDADDHDRYRHPPVDRRFADDYRNGFREGYSRAMQHMRDDHHDHDDEPR